VLVAYYTTSTTFDYVRASIKLDLLLFVATALGGTFGVGLFFEVGRTGCGFGCRRSLCGHFGGAFTFTRSFGVDWTDGRASATVAGVDAERAVQAELLESGLFGGQLHGLVFRGGRWLVAATVDCEVEHFAELVGDGQVGGIGVVRFADLVDQDVQVGFGLLGDHRAQDGLTVAADVEVLDGVFGDSDAHGTLFVQGGAGADALTGQDIADAVVVGFGDRSGGSRGGEGNGLGGGGGGCVHLVCFFLLVGWLFWFRFVANTCWLFAMTNSHSNFEKENNYFDVCSKNLDFLRFENRGLQSALYMLSENLANCIDEIQKVRHFARGSRLYRQRFDHFNYFS